MIGLTLGGTVKEEEQVTVSVEEGLMAFGHLRAIDQEIIKVAFENGINMFDTAEAYARGQSEIIM